MAKEHSNLSVEVSLPAEEIVAEARRWEVADEIGLRVSDAAAVSVVASSPRGRQFIEHLVSLQDEGEARSNDENGADSERCAPAFRPVLNGEWLQIVELARKIESDVASRRRVDGAAALRLARAIRALGGPDDAASGIIPRPAGVGREPR
jgi:hypothetical protein